MTERGGRPGSTCCWRQGEATTHLRELPLDGAQSSLGQLGQFGVANSVNGGGSVLMGQRLHLHTQTRTGEVDHRA